MDQVHKIPPDVVWKAFHDLLGLSDKHIRELQEKRGFSEETIERLKFRTSCPENRQIIENLLQQYPASALTSIGLAKNGPHGAYPAPQYCGYGMTKKKDEHGHPIWEDGVNPILIPYFDETGQITTIRPHKGNPPRPKEIDEEDESWQGMHIYCPLLLRMTELDARAPLVVITEGEFKAAALMQAGIPALAFPGIHSFRNYRFRRALIELLERFSIRHICIAFDNETKDDPARPDKYKPDPWDRYDPVVYACYTAKQLDRAGFQCTIGILPEEWMIDGKADWDGALAKFVKDSGASISKGTAKAKSDFRKVIRDAQRLHQDLHLFPTEAQRILHAKLSRLNHEALCPHGDGKLLNQAAKIDRAKPLKITVKKDSAVEIQPKSMAQAMRACIGRYYTLTPATNNADGLSDILEHREAAKAVKDWNTVAFCDQLMVGWPKPISNFVLSCDFKLISSDGRIEYLVQLSNVHKERTTRHVRLNTSATSKLAEFRKFCNETAGCTCTWAGGEKDLQNLMMDVQAHAAFREIVEVPAYGWMEEQKLWKFADRAFTADGRTVLPDKNLVFWHEGIGYQTDFNERELGSGFEPAGAPVLGEFDMQKAVDSFLLLSQHLHDALGGYEGWIALGATLAYAVHPELFAEKKGAPGLWMTGPKSSGKSTILEWLVKIFGFSGQRFTLAENTTGNFLARYLSKFPCLPAWADEFDDTITNQNVKDMLKNAFDRIAIGKATYDNSHRTRAIRPGTTPFVSGENGVRNPAIRSRYIQLTVMGNRAIGDARERLRIMNKAASDFRNLGHFLMLHRQSFKDELFSFLNTWESNENVRKHISNQRDIWVTGVPIAGWYAAARMLANHAKDKKPFGDLSRQQGAFESAAIRLGSEAHLETAETSYVSQFWIDLISMVQAQTVAPRFFTVQYCTIDNDNRICERREARPTLDPDNFRPICFVAFNVAYMAYAIETRKMTGLPPKLSKNDLFREFKREVYWVKPKAGATSHQLTFGRGEASVRQTCWAFDLATHPYGDELANALRATIGQEENDLA